MKFKRIGILGTGNVGRTLGKGLIDLGYEVRLGSRTAANENAKTWAAASGDKGSFGTFRDAAAFGDLLIVATKGIGTEDAVRDGGVENFAGKIVIDTSNPLDGGPPAKGLFVGTDDSLAERIQKLVPQAHVIKAFNSVGWPHFINPAFKTKPDMFICGQSSEGKAWVTELCEKWGWRGLDLGGLESARFIEPLVMVWLCYGRVTGNRNHALKMVTE